jgi:hypothetical protein
MNEQTALTASERSILERHEAVIKEGLQTFAEVGNALLAIRDGKLYREHCHTFEEYCRSRWGMSKTHANRLVESAKVIENLTPMGAIPQSERQARPLSALSPEDQPAAWQAATDKAKADNRPVTARDVQAEVDRVRQAAIEAEEARYLEQEQEKTEVETVAETTEMKTTIKETGKKPGNAIRLVGEAIAIMSRISLNDSLRPEAWRTMADWLKNNK